MSCVVGPERRAQEVRRVAGQLGRVLLQLPLEVAPRVVRVGLLEPGLGEGVHHRRHGEGLGQPDRLRVLLRDVGDEPLPELDRLGVRVVDAEDPHAVVEPDLDDPAHLGVGARRVVVEVDRVDVLVLLRRVLGVGDGAVGAGREELRVLRHPRVVGAALQRDVEGDLEPLALRGAHEDVEVLEGAEVGVDGVVPPVRRADGVRRPRVALLRHQAVVAALAGGRAIGWIGVSRRRRSPSRRWRQPLGGGAQRARVPAAGLLVEPRALGAGEDLVPRADEGALALDEQRVARRRADQLAERVGGEERVDLVGGAGVQPLGRGRGRVAQRRGQPGEQAGVGPVLAERGRGALEQPRALLEHQLAVDVGLDLDRRVVHPGAERVAPSLDAVGPAARRSGRPHRSTSAGPVVDPHREGVVDPVGVGEHRGGAHRVVALAEDLGGDGEGLALDRLGRPGAAVDERPDVVDGDAADGEDVRRQGLLEQGQGGGRGGRGDGCSSVGRGHGGDATRCRAA